MDRGCIILGSLLLALACAGCGRSPESGKVIDAGLRWNWNGGADATGLADGWDGDGGLLDDAGVADALARPADALPDGALPDGAFPGDGGTETSGVDGGGDDGSVGPEVIEVPVEDVECHFIPEVGEFTPVL